MRRKQAAVKRGGATPPEGGRRIDPAALLELGVRELCHARTS